MIRFRFYLNILFCFFFNLINFKQVDKAVSLRLTKYDSNLSTNLSRMGLKFFPPYQAQKLWPSTIGAVPILPVPEQCLKFNFLQLSKEWRICLSDLKRDFSSNPGNYIVKNFIILFVLNLLDFYLPSHK